MKDIYDNVLNGLNWIIIILGIILFFQNQLQESVFGGIMIVYALLQWGNKK